MHEASNVFLGRPQVQNIGTDNYSKLNPNYPESLADSFQFTGKTPEMHPGAKIMEVARARRAAALNNPLTVQQRCWEKVVALSKVASEELRADDLAEITDPKERKLVWRMLSAFLERNLDQVKTCFDCPQAQQSAVETVKSAVQSAETQATLSHLKGPFVSGGRVFETVESLMLNAPPVFEAPIQKGFIARVVSAAERFARILIKP
jgi:hypothetical protein